MIFPKKKVPSLPQPKPTSEPERLTQEEWKEVAEIQKKINDLVGEEAKRPQRQDFVRILINGEVGQVIDGNYPPPSNPIQFYPISYSSPTTELRRVNEILASHSRNAWDFVNTYRYAVRLKNGYIIRELRPWEIEKVTDR